MFGLPGGSNGGLPIGPVAFWFLIILTLCVVIGFVALIIHVVDEIETETADNTAHLAVNLSRAQDFSLTSDYSPRSTNRCLLPS